MPTIFDVADWFLSKEAMTPKKVQKLCYYYKAWGLALYDKDLLPESIFEAWVHGPVNPKLYRKYKGLFWQDIPKGHNNSHLFNDKELELLESVWATYGDMTANALEVQTHTEVPYRKARRGLDEFASCSNAIKNNDMKHYYRQIFNETQGE